MVQARSSTVNVDGKCPHGIARTIAMGLDIVSLPKLLPVEGEKFRTSFDDARPPSNDGPPLFGEVDRAQASMAEPHSNSLRDRREGEKVNHMASTVIRFHMFAFATG